MRYTEVTYHSRIIAMEEMPSWEEQKKKMSPEFHLDVKRDKVEDLLEKYDPEDAFEEIMEGLTIDPNNEELRRQANLLVNRLDDWSSRLRAIVQH